MTHALDANTAISQLDRPRESVTPASTVQAKESRFGTFAITFGIAFAILYTLFERMNWPLFTYHPAVGKLDFWMQPARSGEGPPMYWYGWILLSGGAAAVVAGIAAFVPPRLLQRATIFCCVLAALWSTLYVLGNYTADRTTFDTEFLRPPWVSAIPAVAGAIGAGYLVSSRWAQRAWAGWLLIMPIGGLAILGYSLKQYFLR
jgi:hypothetical protein